MLDLKTLKDKLLKTNVFQKNKYFDLYCNLILDNFKTTKQKGVTQKHHIIPKYYYIYNKLSINNTVDNVVNLKYSDHVLAHKYLLYCTSDYLYKAMGSAFFFIIGNSNCFNNFSDDSLDILQQDYEEAIKARNKIYDSIEYKNKIKEKFKNQHKGFIWIYNPKTLEQHFINPIDIDKFPSFIKGKKPKTEEEKAKIKLNFNQGQNKINRDAGAKKGAQTRLKKYERLKSEGKILIFPEKAKKVICIEENKIFDSIKEAKVWLGKGDIEACCNHKQLKAGNYH